MGGGGIMFDTSVVEALMMYVPFYPKGTQVVLSDNSEGIIVDNAGKRNLRPMIRGLDGTMIDLQEPENYNLTILRGSNEKIIDPTIEEDERNKMLVPYNMLINLQALKGFLQHSYFVDTVSSPSQAIMQLKRQSEPDLIILDMDMPEMNGIEAAEKIRDVLGEGVPIVFVIDSNDKGLMARCRRAGAAGFIVRPYKPTYIKAEIKRILTGREVVE